ncbi:hypothetical protein FRC11_007354, partial [Ceratobasidium sp. 423]
SSNPRPTDELRSIVTKVVHDTRQRIGKKGGGPEGNSRKAHAREAWYRMLGISAAKEVCPPFEDEYGEPDTLPAFSRDPATGYRRPYPHWKVSLAHPKQLDWIPTYIMRFRGMIPNDNGELSRSLRDLSDEDIVALLYDGPFKTAAGAWNDTTKTPEELAQMRSQARRRQRLERKVAFRKSHFTGIPSLRGSGWDHLDHPGFMSADESDGEGGLKTLRPAYRATWVNNTFDAMDIAESKRIRARLGPNARIPARRVEIVDRPIPYLEHNKVPIRIAICSFGKAWREAHPEELRRAAHAINFEIKVKPSVEDFLSQHPIDHELNEQHPGSPGAAPIEGNEGEDIDFLIDPELLGVNQSQAGTIVPEVKEAGAAGPSNLAHNNVGTTGKFEMPPPPLLGEQFPTFDLHKPAAKKRGRPRKDTINTTDVDGRMTKARVSAPGVLGSQQSEVQGGQVAQVKKRGPGRPPGSKNKK